MRVRVTGTKELDRVAAVLADRADGRKLKRKLSKAIRGQAGIIAKEQRARVVAQMPKRGGLSASLAGESTYTVRTALAGRSVGVTIVDSWRGHDMKAIDAGLIRHPVYGRWLRGQAPQRVPSDSMTGPFLKRRESVRVAIIRGLDEFAAEIARET